MKDGEFAIVEGLNHSNYDSCLVRCNEIAIPEDVTHIKDVDFIYRFYWRTNLKIINQGNYPDFKTIFIDRVKDLTNLSRPRALIMRDKRIFVEQSISLNRDYTKMLEEIIISEAEKIFSESKL